MGGYLYLFAQLVRRELRRKYQGSTLGVLWYLVNPLVLMGAYTLLFGYVFRLQHFPDFPVFLMIGLIAWTFLQQSLLAVDPGKVRVIPDAPALLVAPGRPAAAAEPDRAGPYVIAVGDLRAKKNLAALVTAFAAARRAGGLPHRLVLAGADGGDGARLRTLAAGEPVSFTGYVDDAHLDRLISGADLLVHPSLYEGFGLVVLEAMARGTAVLAARATALPETGGDAAEYFDPSDPGDLARRLEALLVDPDRRAALAAAGLRRAAGFTWEATARATAAVYRELV